MLKFDHVILLKNILIFLLKILCIFISNTNGLNNNDMLKL